MSDLENALKRDIDFLCKDIRTPKSAHYIATQNYLRDRLNAYGLSAQTHGFNVWGLGECKNIFAEAGDSSKPRILIGAHYETRIESGVGADDNASACAVLLELIPLLLKDKGHSYTFVFFDMEENYRWIGLRGSKAFARWYKKTLDRVVILDLVGGALAPGFENKFLQFGAGLSKLNHPQYEFLHLPMKVVEPLGSIASHGARSDYAEFRSQGVPFTFISSGTPWYYHTAFDTPDQLSMTKMAAITSTLAIEIPKAEGSMSPGRIEDLAKFLETFAQTPQFKTRFLEKLLKKNGNLNRLDIIFLYKEVLPTMRREKRKLWAA